MVKFIIRLCGYGFLMYFTYQETGIATVVCLTLIMLGIELLCTGAGSYGVFLKGQEWHEKRNIK